MNTLKERIKKQVTKIAGYPTPLSLAGHNYRFPFKKIQVITPEQLGPKVYCNINFDDQCPVYGQFHGRDYGGRIEEGLTTKLVSLLSKHPEIAITSFVIPCFQGNLSKFRNKFLLSDEAHTHWVKYYTGLSQKFKLEFGLHGYYHRQKEISLFMPHTEFAFKRQPEALQLIQKGMAVFREVGWQAKGFRQPGWDLSTDIHIAEVAKKAGLWYIASNSLNAGLNAGGVERVSNYHPSLIEGVVNFPQNIELDWPIAKIYEAVDRCVFRKAFISIKGHFVDKGVCNCLSEENFSKLDLIAEYIKSKYPETVEFTTLSQLADKIYEA